MENTKIASVFLGGAIYGKREEPGGRGGVMLAFYSASAIACGPLETILN